MSFGLGFGRATPDVSTDADPETGYLVYAPRSLGGQPVSGRLGRHQLRGTAAERFHRGHRLRPGTPGRVLEPGHLRRRANRFGNPFTQLNTAGTSNDNIFYTGNPGQLFNQGVGLGIPNLAKLAGDL